MDNLEKRMEALNKDLNKLTQKKPQKNGNNSIKFLGRTAADLIAGILVGSVIGSMLDDYFVTPPVFFVICFILGIAGSLLNLYKSIQQPLDDGLISKKEKE